LPPLTEQQRIVATLEDYLSRLDRGLKALSLLKLRIQSLWNSILESYCCDESAGDGWPSHLLGDLGKIITGSTPNSKNPQYWGEELPFVTPGDLSEGRRVSRAARGLTELGANSARVLDPGAVLTVCIGVTLGKVGWIDRNCATN
jgi:type I restriction enzyme, S subunit